MSYRVRDVIVSAVGLILLSPVLLGICVLVVSETPGPAIFRQRRVGRGGELFTLHKFRTMHNTGDERIAVRGDPRITRTGAWLRRTKLDELPQLWDVLRGKMSLVGPRPEVPRFVELWPADARRQILRTRPGITDPVSLGLRDEEVLLAEVADAESWYVQMLLPQKTAGYVQYLSRRSHLGDLEVIADTVGALVTRRSPISGPRLSRR